MSFKRFFVALCAGCFPMGFVFAWIGQTGNEQTMMTLTQILTGELGLEDAEWLHESLIQLFDLDQDGVAKPRVLGDSSSPPTDSFKLVEQAGRTRVEIQHLTKLLHRILPLAIGALVLSMAGFALLGGRGGSEGLPPDIMAIAGDHPVWSEVARHLVIAVLIYVTFRVTKRALGTLKIRVDKNSFEIKKGILGVGFLRSVSRSQMTVKLDRKPKCCCGRAKGPGSGLALGSCRVKNRLPF